MSSIVLPFVCIGNFIEDHPLTNLSGANVEAVYNVIVSILSDEKELPRKKRLAPPPSNPPTTKKSDFECPLCKSTTYVIDAKEGNVVCASCGVCTRLPITGNHEYNKPEDGRVGGGRSKVPDWYNNAMTAEEMKEYEIDTEMQMWTCNPYARAKLDADTYELTKRRAAIPHRANTTDRVVGAILTHFLAPKLDLDDTERRVRCRQPLPTVQYEEAMPQFACNRCGAAVWTSWESRRHPCRWGKATRRDKIRTQRQSNQVARNQSSAPSSNDDAEPTTGANPYLDDPLLDCAADLDRQPVDDGGEEDMQPDYGGLVVSNDVERTKRVYKCSKCSLPKKESCICKAI